MSLPTGRTRRKKMILCGRLYLMDETKGFRTVTEFCRNNTKRILTEI